MKPRCITCGCTDDKACFTNAGACWWVFVDRERGFGICSSCATPEQLVAKLLFAAAQMSLGGGGATVTELAEHTALTNARISRALRVLVRKGVVECVGRSAGGDVWRLVVPA